MRPLRPRRGTRAARLVLFVRAFVVGEEALVDSKVGRLCDEAEVLEEDEDALQQLPLHEGGGGGYSVSSSHHH